MDMVYIPRLYGVVRSEMRRRFHVWERRCQEENRPLLKEWVPPTAGQVNMAQALGVAHGWEAITFQGKKRFVSPLPHIHVPLQNTQAQTMDGNQLNNVDAAL